MSSNLSRNTVLPTASCDGAGPDDATRSPHAVVLALLTGGGRVRVFSFRDHEVAAMQGLLYPPRSMGTE